jgi:hypothetical protein
MPKENERQYFIVKHGLDAFESLPGFIWSTGMKPPEKPKGFRQVKSR